MNIDDVDAQVEMADELVAPRIFEAQTELMKRYHAIEKASNATICVEPPYSLNSPQVQARIKDLFWRTTEELVEACENNTFIGDHWQEFYTKDPDVRHFIEELSDALHFLVESTITAGLTHSQVVNIEILNVDTDRPRGGITTRGVYNLYCQYVVLHLGLAANTLKNKPWKQTHVETDTQKFTNYLGEAWNAFLLLFNYIGVKPLELFHIYHRKHQVNRWRQDTNY